MNTRITGRVVGGLFLSAFFLYGGGSYLVLSTTAGGTALPEQAASLGQLSAGSTLLLLNSAAVATVGVLAYGVLRRRRRRTARAYLATRTVEATLLALAPLGTLTLALLARTGAETTSGSGLAGLAQTVVEHSESAYWLAMAILGAGSILFCQAMLQLGLLPRFLALGGIFGYAIFALGSTLELAGYGVGLVLSAPGGLFEIAAGSYLLTKGFRTASPNHADNVAPPRALVVMSGSADAAGIGAVST